MALVFVSCTEKINIELDESDIRFVFEGTFSNLAERQKIRITKTTSYFENKRTEGVAGATVYVTDSVNTFPYIDAGNGNYVSIEEIAGRPGRSYYMTAEIDGEVFEAASTMPRKPFIDSIKFETHEDDKEYYYVKLYAQEHPFPGDFYYWGVYNENIYLTNSLLKLYFASDKFINGSYINGLRVQVLTARQGSWVTLQMVSIPKDYYNYCIAIIKETLYTDDPFQAAPANILGNISNGALGFFYAYAETTHSAILSIEE